MGKRLAFGALALALGACGAKGCGRGAPSGAAASSSAARAAGAPPSVLAVPRAGSAITPDGEFEEGTWVSAARTGPFVDRAGAIARPYSDARALWDDKNLYLTLYAADENVQVRTKEHDAPLWLDDAFSVRLVPLPAGAPAGPPPDGATAYLIDVAPNGTTTDVREGPGGTRDPSWESHIVVGMDLDGTINDPHDEDEEWVVEAALPWSSLGVTPTPGVRIAARISRCDTPKDGKRRCGSWGERTVAVLELAATTALPPPGGSASAAVVDAKAPPKR
jgi:hypothetical protein